MVQHILVLVFSLIFMYFSIKIVVFTFLCLAEIIETHRENFSRCLPFYCREISPSCSEFPEDRFFRPNLCPPERSNVGLLE